MRAPKKTLSTGFSVVHPSACLFFLSLLLLVGCTKEVIVVEEVEKPRDWERLEVFNQTYFSLANFGDRLLLQTASSYLSIYEDYHTNDCLGSTSSYREPISDQWFVDQNYFHLHIHPSRYLPCDMAQERLRADLREVVDSLIEAPALWPPTQSFSRMVLSDDQLLMAYRRNNNDDFLRFALLNLAESDGPINTEITAVKTFEVAGARAVEYRFRHWAVPGGFLFAIWHGEATGLYRVDSQGQYERVLERPVSSVFRHGEEYYAVYQHIIYRSRDAGKSWEQAFEFGTTDISYLKFQNVGEELFGLVNDKCFHLELSEDNFEATQLVTDELAFQKLVHVTKLGDRAVLVTSAGIYTKDWERFLND